MHREPELPRARKTQTGQRPQPVSEIPGQMYGVGPAQQQLQEAMPAPDVRAPMPSSSTAPPAESAQPPLADPMVVARAINLNGGLLAATQRPLEPVTHGLSTGPGGGREALQVATGAPLGETLRQLTLSSGDEYFAALAARIGL